MLASSTSSGNICLVVLGEKHIMRFCHFDDIAFGNSDTSSVNLFKFIGA